MRPMRAKIPTLGVAMVAGAALAAEPETVRDYDECIALVENSPDRAVRLAGEWARFGGGAAARHCHALALIAVGAPDRAVDELLALAAEEPDLPNETRAEVLVQAGEMLLDRGEAGAAGMAAAEARRLHPSSRGALGLRGAVRIAAGDVSGGISDLDRALAEGAEAGLLVRRAAAHRIDGALAEARDDAVRATEIEPAFAAAWLERGRIEARSGDRGAARRSLLEAIGLDREGGIGRLARGLLQRMEAGID